MDVAAVDWCTGRRVTGGIMVCLLGWVDFARLDGGHKGREG